jgi:hypothetical protein
MSDLLHRPLALRPFLPQQKVFTHESESTKGKMTFGVFVPPQAEDGPVPVLYFLSGLTCTHENFVTKVGTLLRHRSTHARTFGAVFAHSIPLARHAHRDFVAYRAQRHS